MAAQTEVKTEPEFKPLCIWCSAPWSDKNVKLEIEGASYCWSMSGMGLIQDVRVLVVERCFK
jgi:hypothetical protein